MSTSQRVEKDTIVIACAPKLNNMQLDCTGLIHVMTFTDPDLGIYPQLTFAKNYIIRRVSQTPQRGRVSHPQTPLSLNVCSATIFTEIVRQNSDATFGSLTQI